jgi:ADP-heptose:LPS heptosyltransferase
MLRLLLVRLSALGDCLHALPAFHRLRAALPEARIAWAVEERHAALLAGLPGLERAIVFERRRGLAGLWSHWRALRAFDAHWAIDLQGNGKSQLAIAGSGARRRLGAARADRAEAWPRLSPRWVIAAARPRGDGGERHAVERGLALVETLLSELRGHSAGSPLAGPAAAPRLDLGLSAGERAAGAERWRRASAGRERAWILHPSERPDPRAWPEAQWLALIEAARRRAPALWISHGPAEAALLERLESRLGPLPRAPEALAPREQAALLTAAAQSGACFVGADRGALHLAASAGLPCLVLAGPTDPARTGPYPPPGRPGSPHRVLTSAAALSCRPCRARTCRLPEGPRCLDELCASAVLDLLEDRRGWPR